MIRVRRYTAADQAEWNGFVTDSKNGTFLFDRNYMDYHADRFEDYSWLASVDKELVAIFPANRSENTIYSHQGLTYGGLVTTQKMTLARCMDVFAAIRSAMREDGASLLVYKTVPSIYHTIPAEEDRYALFLNDAELSRRDSLAVIDMSNRIAPQARRRRSAAKGRLANLVVEESSAWSAFWDVLNRRLMETHGARPVHSLDEILLLQRRFPDKIRLFVARFDGQIEAGVVVYETATVAHAQYIAASDSGRSNGALDVIFMHLIDTVFARKAFFDFGISNENEGRVLNAGLMDFKEGFGARTIVHDTYRLVLT